MSPEDWERVKQIFSAALNVPASHRDAYLRLACGQHAEIRAAVGELLIAHQEASQGFLEPESLVFGAAWLFQPGDCVGGRFRVVKRIARGSNGEVYQVFDERLHSCVALKAIRPEMVGDAATVDRFKREVLITRDIAHEGLCRVFEFVEHVVPAQQGFPDGAVIPCLTMQLLEGHTLEESLLTDRPIAIQQALPIVSQIADALQVLHDAGVVHRDLKPSNVMLVPSPAGIRAVLTDFGLAKPIDEGLFETQGPLQGGAPFFMAPELFRGDRPSRASDIYAFGLLIDEMVTRERAFSTGSLHALVLEKMGSGPSRPSRRADTIPRSWEATILRCLAVDPRDRFASVRDVMATLQDSRKRWLWLHAFPTGYLSRRWRMAAYACAAAALTGAAAVGASSAPASPSVAILPFQNLTGHGENTYLTVGAAGELARRLSRVGTLHVYAPPEANLPLETRKRTTFSLTGHVQQEGDLLRITTELTRTQDGSLVWSQNFEGPLEQALQLEDRLAVEAVGALTTAALSASDFQSLTRLRSILRVPMFFTRRPGLPAPITTSNAAFDAYMRGRYLFEDRTLQSALTAMDHMNRAIQLDPNFAAAYATLADIHGVLMDSHYAPHDRLLADAEHYAILAVAIDPNLPDAQLSLAGVRQAQSRFDEAERGYRLALELHPSFARAKRWFAGMLLQFRRFDECFRLFDEAIRLDPYDYPSRAAYGLALFYGRRPEVAASYLEQLLAERDFFNAHAVLGQVYAFLGATASSRRRDYLRMALHESDVLRAQESSRPAIEYADLVGALAWGYQADAASATPFIERLEAGLAQGSVSASVLARAYAVHHRVDESLTALEAADAEQDRELMYLSVSPLYDSIRNEPRFHALVERRHLPR